MGDSNPSAKIRVIAAHFPDAPTALSLVSQSKTQIVFSWTAGNDGGSPIRDYEVYGDEGDTNLAVDDFIKLADTTFLTT